MSHDITGLRDVLFETLRGIKDGTVPLDKAKAINDVAQTIINSAKAETEHCRVTQQLPGSGFIPAHAEDKPPALPHAAQEKEKPYVGTPIRGPLNGNSGPQARA